MGICRKFALIAAFLAMLAATPVAFGADLQPPSVRCVIGSYVAPASERPVHWHTDDNLVARLYNIPGPEMALLNKCYHQLKGSGNTVFLPLPYIVARTATPRNVQVVICVTDGAYVFKGRIAPTESFTHAFTQKEKVATAKPYCK
jgi:hypothetical protein